MSEGLRLEVSLVSFTQELSFIFILTLVLSVHFSFVDISIANLVFFNFSN